MSTTLKSKTVLAFLSVFLLSGVCHADNYVMRSPSDKMTKGKAVEEEPPQNPGVWSLAQGAYHEVTYSHPAYLDYRQEQNITVIRWQDLTIAAKRLAVSLSSDGNEYFGWGNPELHGHAGSYCPSVGATKTMGLYYYHNNRDKVRVYIGTCEAP